MIYFIESPDGRAIKVGHASSVADRFSQLQTAHHQPLRLLATIDWPDSQEEIIHARFKHLRLRGEWFTAADELRDWIAFEIAYDSWERVLAIGQRLGVSQGMKMRLWALDPHDPGMDPEERVVLEWIERGRASARTAVLD